MEYFKKSKRALLYSSLAMAVLTGCNDSNDDAADERPEYSGTVVDYAEQVSIEFTSVTPLNDSGKLQIEFIALNENDVRFSNLSSPRFTVAKLLPAEEGKSSQWVSYINRVEEAPTAENGKPGPGTADQLQATFDNSGDFTNHLDGSYSYVTDAVVVGATNPLNGQAIAWEAGRTHRVGMQATANNSAKSGVNGSWDWVPSGDTQIHYRDIVVTETCNSCHTELKVHGSREEIKYCTTCHNPGSTDANSGNSVDMMEMVHKIHSGENLMSLNPENWHNGDNPNPVYTIWGYRESAHTYGETVDGVISGVGYPQDLRNCTTCHAGQDDVDAGRYIPEGTVITRDGGDWKTTINAQTCGSCHDDRAFTTEDYEANPWKKSHKLDDKNCESCHGPTGYRTVDDMHGVVLANAKQGLDAVDFVIEGASVAGQTVNADLRITLNGTDVTSLDELSQYPAVEAKLTYNTLTDGHYEQRYKYVALKDTEKCVFNADGVINCQIDGLTIDPVADQTLRLTVIGAAFCFSGSTGELVTDCDGKRVTRQSIETPLFEMELSSGQEIPFQANWGADPEGCASCHGDIEWSYHFDSRDFAQCSSCHNGSEGGFRANRATDLKYNIHHKHKNLDDYPGTVENCSACHTDEQLTLGNMSNTAWSVANGGGSNSPVATVCASCHVEDLDGNGTLNVLSQQDNLTADSKIAAAHIMHNGGKFEVTAEESGWMIEARIGETCVLCHGEGSVGALDKVHSLK